MSTVLDKFLRYVKIDTQSDGASESNPSTEKQFDLAKILVAECEAIGLQNVILTEKCHVLAELPANTDKAGIPVIGFNAHMDTSPDYSGKDVKPRLVKYEGGEIVLNEEEGVVLSPKDFPSLKSKVGKTLVVTDGMTLLGADDKAGVAEIMTAMEFLIGHPEIEHGTIKVCFTPDEEIGRGVEHFEYEKFGADFAYTMDGGEVGGIEFENFNACSAFVDVHGRMVHPGSAKDKMIHAANIAMEFHAMLPAQMRAEHTEGYDGFFHLHEFSGNVDAAKMMYIVRDHDREKFEAKKRLMLSAASYLNQKHGNDVVDVTLVDSYFNMREKVEPVMHIVETAKEAMVALGIEPVVEPIRGGTDGARMSFQGLPTPNLFTGGHNYHGRYEYAVVETMELAVQLIVKIVNLYATKA